MDVTAFSVKMPRLTDDECWPFQGARVPAGGYGRAWMNKKLQAAHRIAYMLAKGNIPAGLDVMHVCDNPPCVNPRHLHAVTTTENMRDCVKKGRQARAGGRRLTPQQVVEVRALRGVERAQDVASKYGVSLSTVHMVWTGRSYRNLAVAA